MTTLESPTHTCWDCKTVCEPLISDVDGSVAYVCPTHGCIAEGFYLGVAYSDWEPKGKNVPYHYFVSGHIKGLAQTSFGFPADPDTPPTTGKPSSELITDALKEA